MNIEEDFVYADDSKQPERNQEIFLRPKNFDEYIGQEKIVKNIDIMIKSSLIRKEAMDHALLSGPPGLGKTSLAMIISKSLGSELHFNYPVTCLP